MAQAKRSRGTRSGNLRVLVTGATGFVGFHTAKLLHEAGHEVRLLVRSPDKMRRVLAPFGLDTLAHVHGDIADEESVARALEGCDAVVHSAAMVNVLAKDATTTILTNRRGTELVIGGAVERGISRIVQVSSSTALFNPGMETVDENSPLGTQTVG
ncbi:MAG: SDR family NAD(P)-dependent oxidoreductase [Pseudomonadales bacterium]|nr:SDR family NAD(P)-dependent oxidoreductase [Pseudomonadales bacterium]